SGRKAPLLTVDSTQICQRTRGAPRVPGLPKRGESALVQPSRRIHVTRRPCDIALLTYGPGCPALVTQSLKNLDRFGQFRSCTCVVPANLKDAGEVMETPRDGRSIRQ